MGQTHFSGPLVVGGKQVTGSTTIAPLAQTISVAYDATESQAISDKVDVIIQKLIDTGIIAAS